MTRKDQYIAFLPFFQAEEKRYTALTQRATAFLGLTSVIVLFGGVSMADYSTGIFPFILVIATAFFVLMAVLGALASLWVRAYKDICDLENLVTTIDEEEYSEEDIYSILLANMADATRHNRNINTTRANWLQFSATCFAIAIIIVSATSVIIPHEKTNSTTTTQVHP